ncbi:hypothetical protein FKW77_000650 [Venturia effusa]|uniref:FAD-binding domain-containing protein n=1 Tax=Venturia effusa TaxID=50376 RepID=A0A517L8F8_9PEZI|nr:hypothetical protein FKW77_000650 [Venturia effusa]
MKRHVLNPSPDMSRDDIDVVAGTKAKSAASQPELVTVVGAGPAGLMLGATLARYGIKARILDDRDNQTSTGRADGLQPKSIETFQQLGLADTLLRKGVRIYDICFWNSTSTKPLSRTRREIHYPQDLDVENPFILLVHQGMVEHVFIEDLRERAIQVNRGSTFQEYKSEAGSNTVEVDYVENETGDHHYLHTQYLVGCDGAHSNVRRSIPGATMVGESTNARWGVLDGVIETDFPDLWSKVVIQSEAAGTVLCIPRERNMTRLYIELDHTFDDSERATQDLVMKKAQAIMAPYSVKWIGVEWFSVYKVGQRVASTFASEDGKVFIAGDASHTHSPKAAQGMNTSMHDTFNLSWKLNLAIRGLCKPSLLSTYQSERRKIAQDLIEFDATHAAAFVNGDAKALADNFAVHVGFISGFGVKYAPNVVNLEEVSPRGILRAGELVAPAKVTRYVDANPVNLELDIPLLGQFKTVFFVKDIHYSSRFLALVTEHISSLQSVMGRASLKAAKSYSEISIEAVESDEFIQPERYVGASRLFTFATVTEMKKSAFEISDLPPLLQKSRWSLYLDDLKDKKSGKSCTEKWVGGAAQVEVVVVNIRPDGYVGSVKRFDIDEGAIACQWLDTYFGAFLSA